VPEPRRFTLRQRIVLRMIIWAGYWFIRLIGPTLRVCISREEGAQETIEQRPLIGSFWHACIIPATYMCRNLGVRVMSSNSYDGEYMGRIIRQFGFVPVKGSSSRNAVRALLGLRRDKSGFHLVQHRLVLFRSHPGVGSGRMLRLRQTARRNMTTAPDGHRYSRGQRSKESISRVSLTLRTLASNSADESRLETVAASPDAGEAFLIAAADRPRDV
jgi:hypothetical protein